MTELQKLLAEIRERAERATPGPWESRAWEENRYYDEEEINDCNFAAHARTDIPTLLAIVERQAEALEFYANTESYGHDETYDGFCVRTPNEEYLGATAKQAQADVERICKGET